MKNLVNEKSEKSVRGLEIKTYKKVETVVYSVWIDKWDKRQEDKRKIEINEVETCLFGHGDNGWNWENRVNNLWNEGEIKGDCVGMVLRLEKGELISSGGDKLRMRSSKEWECLKSVSMWLGSKVVMSKEKGKMVIYWREFDNLVEYVEFMRCKGYINVSGEWEDVKEDVKEVVK